MPSRNWTLSAILVPIGRSSKEEDWHFLGQMAAAVGAPEEALMTPFSSTPPNEIHFWIWEETGAGGESN